MRTDFVMYILNVYSQYLYTSIHSIYTVICKVRDCFNLEIKIDLNLLLEFKY